VLTGDGTAGEREHGNQCATCAERLARLGRDLDRMGQVLTETTEPRTPAVRAPRAWLPAIGLAAMVAAALPWGVTGPRRPVPPGLSAALPPELGSLLEEISTVMFSVSGDPGLVGLDVASDESLGGIVETGCDPRDWSALSCGGS